jgi:hypothetical protein
MIRKDAPVANKPFSGDVTFSILPKEIFPLWFSDVSDFEVVKNHSRLVYRVRADGECYYLKVVPASQGEDGWAPDKGKLELSSDFARHLRMVTTHAGPLNWTMRS